MQGSLPSDLTAFIDDEVASGRYPDADAVILTGLRVLRQLEQRKAALRADIQVALDELERGEGIDLDDDEIDAYFDEIQATGRARAQR